MRAPGQQRHSRTNQQNSPPLQNARRSEQAIRTIMLLAVLAHMAESVVSLHLCWRQRASVFDMGCARPPPPPPAFSAPLLCAPPSAALLRYAALSLRVAFAVRGCRLQQRQRRQGGRRG